MNASVGMRSLALAFPGVVRDNDYFRARHPAGLQTPRETSR